MSREIKFRVWDKNQKEMADVDHLTWNRGVEGLSEINQEMPKWFFLMQFTGLKDRNNKEVYEEDLIRINGYLATIRWNPMFCSFEANFGDGDEVQLWEVKDIEVIGNTFENPELLDN